MYGGCDDGGSVQYELTSYLYGYDTNMYGWYFSSNYLLFLEVEVRQFSFCTVVLLPAITVVSLQTGLTSNVSYYVRKV